MKPAIETSTTDGLKIDATVVLGLHFLRHMKSRANWDTRFSQFYIINNQEFRRFICRDSWETCARAVDGCFHNLEIYANICAPLLPVYMPLCCYCERAHTDAPPYRCQATVCLKGQEGSMTCYTRLLF